MSPESFCYWLQGFFELSGKDVTNLSEEQTKHIKNHLNLVFYHSIDPKATENLSKEEQPKAQKILNDIHQGGPHGPNWEKVFIRC